MPGQPCLPRRGPKPRLTDAPNAKLLTERALGRAAGGPLVSGNAVRILRDAKENFPAWLEAIGNARHKIYFESYIFADDRVGREFAAALAECARRGVQVRVLYDWLGTWRAGALWRQLGAAGAQVLCFNPLSLHSPLDWSSRDHRKTIAIDGRVGFVTGLCVSEKWCGDPARKLEPWRDTGVEVRGPAVADLEIAFAEVWQVASGAEIPAEELTPRKNMPAAGSMSLRVIASVPNIARLYRLDQTVAGIARERLWLTDAYFVGTSAYVQALCAAAADDVDVRLLVPGASDIAILSPLSRAGYRPLLEAGVRVFEWNGTMLHAKSAVADHEWARVGSTNLNVASWLQNYELDVAVENRDFAEQMAAMYEDDLTRATEIVLTQRNRVRTSRPGAKKARRARSGSAGRAAAGALTLGSAVGAALTNKRALGPAEAGFLVKIALAMFAVAAVFVLWPKVLAVPLAIIFGWLGVAMILKAHALRRRARAAAQRR